jgi:flagellar biosynthesis/type III secretory pathway protein FliH
MSLRMFAVALALVTSLALAACGSDEDTSSSSVPSAESAEESATPAQARAEIGEVRAALDSALASLREGDAKAAENAVSEGYLQHFEKVEGPLEKVDRELNEGLEDGIREELRDTIRNGGSVEQVTKMISEIKADLDTAEQKLR